MKDIKIDYIEIIVELNLKEFNNFILKIQKQGGKYGRYINRHEDLLLTRDILLNKFKETFFEIIQVKKD